MKFCVYCGSSSGARDEYKQSASELGKVLAERGFGLVYGGASVGLMGIVADATLAHGGEVIGVIPRALQARELAHKGLNELHLVDSMHQRKALMVELSDGFIALPGGFGTLDELFTVLTLIQTKKMERFPMVLFGKDFWDGMLDWIKQQQLANGYISEADLDLLHITDDPEFVLKEVQQIYKELPEN